MYFKRGIFFLWWACCVAVLFAGQSSARTLPGPARSFRPEAAVRASTDIAAKPREIIPDEMIAFSKQSAALSRAVAAAIDASDARETRRQVSLAAEFYLRHLQSSYSYIRLASQTALTELASNGYFAPSSQEHNFQLARLRAMAKAALNDIKQCSGSGCQELGLFALLHAALPAGDGPAPDMEPLLAVMGRDYGSEEANLTVAVYVFQAAAFLDGPRGVYLALRAFDQMKKANHNPRSFFQQYTHEDYRVYIEAVENMAYAGEEGKKWLKLLAAPQSTFSLAAQVHAAAELAYLPLTETEREENKHILRDLYCRHIRDYSAYTELLYHSPSVSTSSVRYGETLMQRLGYAYGGGQKPHYVAPAGTKSCLPAVPREAPADLQSEQFLREHTVDLALLFVPVPGTATLKGIVSGLKSAVVKSGIGVVGRTFLFIGGKRAGYSVLRKAFGYPPKAALAQLYRWGAKPSSYAGTPAVRGEAYLLDGLAGHGADLSKPLPVYPGVQNPRYMWRGASLGEKDILRVMEKGYLRQDVSSYNNHLLMSYSLNARHVSEVRVVNITDDPSVAELYSRKFLSQEKNIPLVVQIKGDFPSGSVVHLTRDIPASSFTRVDAMLYVDGKNQWGTLQRTAEGKFLFYPYP